MEDKLRSKLIGEQLSSVEFIQDYLQLHFDGRTITSYVWPTLEYGENIFCFGDEGYRNKLCDLIGHEVKDIYFKDKDFLVLLFDKIDGVIKLSLDPTNPEVVAEIAIFYDDTDKTWAVFD